MYGICKVKKRYRIIERNENQPISCGNKLNITPKKIQEKKTKNKKRKICAKSNSRCVSFITFSLN